MTSEVQHHERLARIETHLEHVATRLDEVVSRAEFLPVKLISYGLAGGVQSADVEQTKSVARRMRTGQVDINGGGFNAAAPFGGYGQSGNGRERGEWGIDGYLETKSIQL